MLPQPSGLCASLLTPELPVSGPIWWMLLRMRSKLCIGHLVFEGLPTDMLPPPPWLRTPGLPVSGPGGRKQAMMDHSFWNLKLWKKWPKIMRSEISRNKNFGEPSFTQIYVTLMIQVLAPNSPQATDFVWKFLYMPLFLVKKAVEDLIWKHVLFLSQEAVDFVLFRLCIGNPRGLTICVDHFFLWSKKL